MTRSTALVTLFLLTFLLTAVLLAAACTDRGPTTPTSTSPLTGASGDTHVKGVVFDTLSRPLPGARVEVLDGPLAGQSTTADDSAAYVFTGNAGGAVRLRGSRDGFESQTISAVWQPRTSGQIFGIFLKTRESAVPITPGSYTLTVRSDPSTAAGNQRASCAGFPADLLRRTYEATITVSPFVRADDYFLVELSSPTMIKPPGATCATNAAVPVVRGCFSFHVAGPFVGFEIENGWGWDWVEEWPGFRYLTVEGYAPTGEPATSNETSTTIPFAGTFDYCELKSALGGNSVCHQVPADQIIEHRSCSSTFNTMTFTKR
jgi:hypothetical protein